MDEILYLIHKKIFKEAFPVCEDFAPETHYKNIAKRRIKAAKEKSLYSYMKHVWEVIHFAYANRHVCSQCARWDVN